MTPANAMLCATLVAAATIAPSAHAASKKPNIVYILADECARPPQSLLVVNDWPEALPLAADFETRAGRPNDSLDEHALPRIASIAHARTECRPLHFRGRGGSFGWADADWHHPAGW